VYLWYTRKNLTLSYFDCQRYAVINTLKNINGLPTQKINKKSLKILNGYSETTNRMTDNAMAKQKETNNDRQNTTQKNKQHEQP